MKINVLVFPCGSQAAIEINNCLKESLRFEIFGASSVDDHGKHIYKNYIGDLPNISAHNFIQKLNEAINNDNIKYIIPTHDSVALYLMENRLHIGATIVASDLETAKVCRYKSMLYERFKKYDFNPITYNNIYDILTFPIFLKPDNGQGETGLILLIIKTNCNISLLNFLIYYCVSTYPGRNSQLIVLPIAKVTLD